MFAKLKESKLFKSLSETLRPSRKVPAKEAGVTDSSETKTEPSKETGKAAHPFS
jgi:hypothetical protein